MNPDEMTPEQVNVAIAKLCGMEVFGPTVKMDIATTPHAAVVARPKQASAVAHSSSLSPKGKVGYERASKSH